MARRDVDLVIRAKNEASKAIDQINAAIETFVGGQKDLTKGAEKTNSVLTKLGVAAKSLGDAFNGASLNNVGQQLKKARDEIARLEQASKDAAGAAIGYTRELRQAASETARLQNEARQVAASIKEQTAALRESKGEQRAFNASLREAEAARKALVEQDRKLTSEIRAQASLLETAKAKYAALKTEIAQTAEPTKRLVQAFEAKGRAIAAAETRLEDLRTTQGVVQNAITQTSNAIERSNQKLTSSQANYAKLEATIGALAAKQKDLGAAIKGSQASQDTLEKAANQSTAALDRQDAALVQAQGELKRVETAAVGAAGGMDRLAGSVRGQLLQAFGAQRTATQQANAEWAKAQATVKALADGLDFVGPPTREMAAALLDSKVAAAQAKAEYIAQRDILNGLRNALQQNAAGQGTLSAQVERANRVYDAANAALAERRKEILKGAEAERALIGSSNQAATAAARVASASRQAAAAQAQAAKETITFSEALKRFYGNSRTALSFTQRLRSEVLSLVAAYGGLFAAIQGGRSAVDAIRTIEAAQSRLNVVFSGDQNAVGQELEFIRETARRLGIEFGTLAQEYTKFAVATKGTNLEGEATRNIFVKVAEAARVNKLRLEDVKGVFTALSQIAGKGAVQMEELRQQLGDRLPGAVQIMADALGVSVEKLFDMTQAGEVSSDALNAFANELDKRFGAQLPAALQTTTTAIGRFQNAVFEAFETVARSGFIESFTDAVLRLQETLQSEEGTAALKSMGQAAARLIDVFSLLAQNFDLVIVAIGLFVGSRVAPFVVALGAAFGRLAAAVSSTYLGMVTAGTAAGGLATRAGLAASAVRGLGLAIRGLISSTGVGLAITVIGGLIGNWVTSTDEATEAMERHKALVEKVKQAYFEAEGGVGKFVDKVKEITKVDAQANLEATAEAAKDARDALTDALDFGVRGDSNLTKPFTEVLRAFQAFENGAFASRDSFLATVDDILASAEDLDTEAKVSIQGLVRAYLDTAEAAGQAGDVIKAQNGDMEAAARLAGEVAEKTDDQANAIKKATENTGKYNEAVTKLQEGLPGVADQLERIQEVADLEAALQSAIKYATTMGQVERALALFQERLQQIQESEALSIFDNSNSNLEKSVALLKQFEGFQPTGKFDVNAFRAGFGSDTVTLADGTIKKITEGMKVAQEDALRDLVRRIGEFQDVIRKQIGGERFGQFSPEQQAVLTSIAFNFGRLPERIVEAVRTGNAQEIATAIRGLAGDNQGVNANRRNTEATIFEGTGADIIGQEEERLKLLEKQREEAEKAAEKTKEDIANGQFEIAQQELINAGKERQAAIEEAVRKARESNKSISETEIALIAEQAGKLFDLQNAGKALEEQRKEAAAAEAEVNNLLTIRQQLTEQLKLLEADGNADGVNKVREGLVGINEQLALAIEQAVLMYQAIGGTEANAAVAKLQTLKLTLDDTGAKALIDLKQVANLIAGGVTNAFDQFAQAIANGEKATTALKDAFLQFAADFLREIAKMIIQQIILNALKTALAGAGFPIGHHGGLVSSLGRRSRTVDPMLFMGAMRYHDGGIAGLAPDEVPIIAQKNEEILTSDDPRHRNNLGKSGGGTPVQTSTKVINAFDGSSFLEEALSTPFGEEVLLNYVRANSGALRSAMGV